MLSFKEMLAEAELNFITHPHTTDYDNGDPSRYLAGAKKISTMRSGHKVFMARDGRQYATYHVISPDEKKRHFYISGEIKRHPNGYSTLSDLTLNRTSPDTGGLKAHDVYHHLITKHKIILQGDNQSRGTIKVWQRLAAKPGVRVHGFDPNEEKGTETPRIGVGHTHVDPEWKYDPKKVRELDKKQRMKLVAYRTRSPRRLPEKEEE